MVIMSQILRDPRPAHDADSAQSQASFDWHTQAAMLTGYPAAGRQGRDPNIKSKHTEARTWYE